jgi:hypothetical protein
MRRVRGLLGLGPFESSSDSSATSAGRLAARNVTKRKPGAGEDAEALVLRLVACGTPAPAVDERRHDRRASEPASTLP